MEEVVIVGGGIAGLATVVALKKVGVRALVLERSEGLRATGSALSLFPNAWHALDALGASDKLTSLYTPFSKGYVTDMKTKAIQEVRYSACKGSGGEQRTVHRKMPLEVLAEELPPNTIRFSSKLTSIETQVEQGSSICILALEDGTVIKSKVVIGCDGVHSRIAHWLGLGAPVDSGRSAIRGVAVYPRGHGFNHEVQQFVDVSKRAGFIPLNDKEVYWFFACKAPPKGADMGGDPNLLLREVADNLAKDFPSVYLDIVGHSDLSTLTWAPLMFRYPWDVMLGNLTRANVTVAGDAMHPMTPDLGQGGCLALEDAVVLDRHIRNSVSKRGEIETRHVGFALESYVRERRWRAATLITASFLSGWVQQDGSSWWMKFLRDVVFYKFLLGRAVSASRYDCGKLC
ncbi:monooxygenase 2-like isoform X2 [Syzygium oleosum]|uniref:monooxygenase 2-like isoform X2 n=1 Tax=Syzygium oleosum TaxID=219896 RepID=UPI0011D1EF0F|nr:monooxygenase 2-like isoform X2 [Syzygium oleosum]